MDLPGAEEQIKRLDWSGCHGKQAASPPTGVPVKWLGREEAVEIWPPSPTKLDLGPPLGET